MAHQGEVAEGGTGRKYLQNVVGARTEISRGDCLRWRAITNPSSGPNAQVKSERGSWSNVECGNQMGLGSSPGSTT